MFDNWYEFLSLAAILRIAVPLAGILTFEGMETNSRGLYVIAGFLSSPLLPEEF